MSTALSDLVLAIICLACIARLGGPQADNMPSRLLGWALLLAAIAAAVGAARFAGLGSAGGELADVHLLVSRIAGQVGIPLIGLAFLAIRMDALRREEVARFLPLGLMILFGLFEFYVDFPLWREASAVIGVAMVLLICISFAGANPIAAALGVCGGAGILVAGLLIGTQGEWGGFLRIDMFHYALAACYFALTESLRRMGYAEA